MANQAIRMCFTIGLHRDSRKWIPDKTVQEARKWAFWCAYDVDSHCSMMNAKPPVIDDDYVSVGMPEVDLEDDLYYHRSFFVEQIKLRKTGRKIAKYLMNISDREYDDWKTDTSMQLLDTELRKWHMQLPDHLRFQPAVAMANPLVNGQAGM
jgi:hypothetical protein